jgi:hypothetical protein
LSFRDGKSDDEDDDDDCDGFNGDSGDYPSLENSGKTSPSSGEYPAAGAVNFLTLDENLALVRNAECFSMDKYAVIILDIADIMVQDDVRICKVCSINTAVGSAFIF